MEIWKDIPNCEGYQASTMGNIKSLKNGRRGFGKARILRQKLQPNGYKRLNISINGKPTQHYIHRLILLTFKLNSKLECNHKDGNKENNRLENLEYCTRSENQKHRYYVLKKRGGCFTKR